MLLVFVFEVIVVRKSKLRILVKKGKGCGRKKQKTWDMNYEIQS